MKERRKMSISERLRVTLTLGTLVTLVLFIIATIYAAATWKSDMEHRLANYELDHVRLEEQHATDQAEYQKDKIKTDKEMARLTAKQAEQDAIFAEIRTDLKWIRTELERRD